MASVITRAMRNAAAMMRAAEWGSSSSIPSPLSASDPQGRMDSALSISTVLACVKALHDDVRVMPFAAYAGDRAGAHVRLGHQPQVVTQPFGPDVEPAAGFGQLVVSIAMRGNAYAGVVSTDDATGLPDQLVVLHPDAVKPRRGPEGRYFELVGGATVGPRQIVHMTGMMLPGAIMGVDVLTQQRLTYSLAAKVASYGESFFDAGASPAGVISIPGKGDRAKAREARAMWESSHSGVVNAHRPAVMFGGATWQQLTITPENAQFLETRRFLREEICGLYGVPLQRIQAIVDNASQGGGKGLDALDAQYVKHGLLPTVAPIEGAWQRLIPGGDATFPMFGLGIFLRASAEVRSSIASSHRVGGIRTINEIRADEGWSPLEGGDDLFTPLNSNTTTPAGGADNAPPPGQEA